MSDSILRRVPVVGALGYVERVRRLPSSFTATLQREPENRYFLNAMAVLVSGEKLGYVAPEVARRYSAPLAARAETVSCPACRASVSDHQTSGVELLLDFSELPLDPAP